MITHGNKQISEIVYARKASEGGGAVRLTNIIRGAQVVFGDLIPRLGWQLLGATKAAILAAFGQTDGKAVIKATNAYLNALAENDPNKASALAGFINEDPMLVCSLGLQPQGVTMPIRFIHGGYTNQVSTGIVPTTTMVINAKFRMNSVTLYHPVFQQGYISEEAMTTRCIAVNGNSNMLNFTLCKKTGGGGKAVTFDYNVSGRWMDMQMNDTQVIVNGTTYVFTETDRGSKNDNPIWLLGRGDSYGATDIDIQLFQTIDGDNKHTFVPFKDGQNCYIIDIESGNKIQGSFTIAYTLPDGTPWTPLNQPPPNPNQQQINRSATIRKLFSNNPAIVQQRYI